MKTATSSSHPATSSTSIIGQAQQWLRRGSLSEMLGKVPTSLKSAGSSIGKLSTTQKVVGGAALALGVGLLARKRSGKSTGSISSDQATTLHELLLFVNDRIAGYERAVAESSDLELRTYYQQLVQQSHQFANNLNAQLHQQGDTPETGTTLKGKLYRTWMDTKAVVTGGDEAAILQSNIYGEEWAIKAYQDALRSHTLSGSVRQSIHQQYDTSKRTYKRLNQLASQQ